VPGYDDWRQRTGWQQAAVAPPAAVPPPAVTWYRGTGKVAPSAPAPSARSERTARVASAPAQRGARSAAGARGTAGRSAAVAQGDREDPRRALLRYHIELGSYRSRVRAQQLARDLVTRGYRPVITKRGKTHQVLVKNFPSRDAARKAAITLGKALKLEPVVTASR
jgi:hypothetical protein